MQLDPGTTYTVSQVGADTVIDMGGGNQMILVGVQMSSLPDGLDLPGLARKSRSTENGLRPAFWGLGRRSRFGDHVSSPPTGRGGSMRRAVEFAILALILVAAPAGAAPRRPDPGAGIGPPVIPLPRGAALPAPDPITPTTPVPPRAPIAGKVYLLEMLQTPDLPPELKERLKPLNSLIEVENFLKLNRVPFAWQLRAVPASSLVRKWPASSTPCRRAKCSSTQQGG